MMRIGIVGNPGGWSSENLADAAERVTGFRALLDPGKLALDVAQGTVRCGEFLLNEFDALVIKKLGEGYAPDHLDRLELLRFVHAKGVPVFSAPLRISRLLDRLTCTVTLAANGIPMPPTTVTPDLEVARNAVEQYGRAVLKPLFSSKARGMQVIEAGRDTADQLRRFQAAGNPVVYIQQLIDLPGRDLGVTFLGGDYLATYARVGRKDSWNTTTRSGGRYEAQQISQELLDLAYQALAPFGLDFTCVDIAESSSGPVVFEVSAFGGFRGLNDAHGMDIGDRLVRYVLGRISN